MLIEIVFWSQIYFKFGPKKNNFTLEKLINYKSNDKEVNSNKSGIYKIKCKDCEDVLLDKLVKIWKLDTKNI